MTTAHDRHQLDRLVFFSDAIFAIAITLLIIEVRVPHLARVSEEGLAQALLGQIPQYIGFVVSFFVIGRFWIGHHRVFGWLARSDDRLVWRNLLFMLTIAFMPFPTAVLSQFAGTRVAVGLYAGWLLLAGVLNYANLRYATRGPLLSSDAPVNAGSTRGVWIPLLTAALALALAIVHPLAGVGALLASPLIGRLLMWGRRDLSAG